MESFNALLAATDPARPWTFTFVGLTFLLYLVIGWRSRVRETAGFYVAGGGVPAIANGAATAADWMSAASFIGMAGLISFKGSDGAAYLMGWTGGYVLLALLLAPYLRKFGKYTVPDFIGARYYSETARVVAAICAIFVSITYVAGQMKGVGVVFSRFLEVPLPAGVGIGMAIVAFFAVLGGMKGITWTQVAQYFVLIFAFLVPTVAISKMLTGSPIPQVGFVFSDISIKINEILIDLGQEAYTQPFRTESSGFDKRNLFCLTAALMFGTAGLPHVIVRFYTVKSVRAARYSAVWALLFIAILYTAAGPLGMFARYNIIQNLHGATIEALTVENEDGEQVAELSKKNQNPIYRVTNPKGEVQAWAERWQRTDLLTIKDSGKGTVSLSVKNGVTSDANFDKDIIVLSTPEVANLPPWVIALVAAGGLAAALSTAAGLLLVISSSLAHDLWIRYRDPDASEAKKLRVGRISIFIAVLVAGYFGMNPPGFVGEVVAFAFGLAASSFFPAIFLGIFFKRVNRQGAVAGMIVGLTFTLIYIGCATSTKILPFLYEDPSTANNLLMAKDYLFGIGPQGIGTLGMVLNLVVTLVVSAVTPPPPKEIGELIESVRVPIGSGMASEH